MDITKYEIELTRHALIRADEREIEPFMYLATIKGGRIERTGKNAIKFSKEYKNLEVICIGEIFPGWIKILTIERIKK